MNTPKVYVVIVTYNGIKWIERCLHDVLLSDITLNLVLIDNGSTDGTKEFIKNNYPELDLIETSENLGFGKANNIGLKKALNSGADYAFLLNQDGYVEKDAIRKLIEFQINHSEYGVLSPRQMNGDGSANDKKFEDIVLSKKCIINSFEDSGTTIHNVYFVMAAFWLISAECLRKVGLFDPIFYHYGEDGDYLSRVRYHGFKIGVVMNSIGYHDRQSRVVPDIQQLKSFYSSQLASLTNINRTFAFCFGKVTYFYLKFSIRYISKLKFTLLKENTRFFFNLLSKTRQILESRNNNKQVRADQHWQLH
ncbi:MAG TPA: glycosyltransferase family 2 protein [Mucilaginibacter sp.]|nr:glycosyltransferase family 2 protein [Mucilaginibacter sp.]